MPSEPNFRRTNTSQSVALGLELIGLISLRHPLLVGLAAGFGIARIKGDDSLSQLFRSDTPEFKIFEIVTRRFPSNEFDVLIVVEGKTLLQHPPTLAGLRSHATTRAPSAGGTTRSSS